MTNQVGEMLPNGRIAGTSAEVAQQQSKARIVDMVTKENVNQQAVDKAVGLILKAVKESAGWTRDLFLTIRMCSGDIELAKGSLHTAEQRAIKKFREMIAQTDPGYPHKIKTLNDLAKYNGDTQLTYSVTKSKLFGIIDNAEDLRSELQKLWLFENEHEGAPMKLLPNGFLDVFSDRYKDDKKGSTLFMSDVRMAKEAEAKLAVKLEMRQKELAKQAAAETGQHGEQTQQGIENGATEQHGLQIKSTQEALNRLIRLVHDADNHEGVEIAELNAILTTASNAIQGLLDKANEAIREKVAEAGNVHHAAQPVVPTTGVAEMVRPEWIAAELWEVMTNDERVKALDDGQKAWEEEEQLIAQVGEDIKDAESNEPVANNG